MCIKKFIKGGLFLALICLTVNSVKCLGMINYSNFSSYLNVMKGDYFENQVTIKSLRGEKTYQKGVLCNLEYEEEIPVLNKFNANVGFLVNNEFYMNEITITKKGTYEIDIIPYEFKDNMYKPKLITPLESFVVTVGGDMDLFLKNDTIYIDNYDSAKTIKDKILDNFSDKVSISDEQDKILLNTLNEVLNKPFYAPEIIPIEVIYKDRKMAFKVRISTNSLSNISIEDVSIPYVERFANEMISDVIGSELEGYIVESIRRFYKFDGEVNILEMTGVYPMLDTINKWSNRVYATVTDKNTKEETNFYFNLLIYKESVIKEENIRFELKDDEYYVGETELKPYRLYFEIPHEQNGERIIYKGYSKELKLDEYNINYEQKIIAARIKYKNLTVMKTIPIKIIEKEDYVKIATRYNYIIFDKKTDIVEKNQISIIKNNVLINPDDVMGLGYKILYSRDKMTLNIKLEDKNGNLIDSESICIVYDTDLNPGFIKKGLIKLGQLFI